MMEEIGIHYTRDEEEAKELGYTEYTYNSQYLAVDFEDQEIKRSTHANKIYCISIKDVLQLVNHWNRQQWAWKYYI